VSQKSSEVATHEVERPARGDGRRAGLQRVAVELSDERDVAHRVIEVRFAEIEIIHRKRLLEDGRVLAFGKRDEHGVRVAHVVPADDAGAVREALRMPVVRGA